jgi:hypothetical protein
MALNEKQIWDYLKKKIGNDYGVAALMGNMLAESGLNPKNLENTGNVKLGMTDDEYTAAVDNGSYTKEQFIHDGFGYGTCQWTFNTRKKALYDFAKSQNTSIGDCEIQLDFLYQELSISYKSVLNTLKNAKSVLEASNAVLLKYECPYDQSVAAQNKRASYGQNYYNKYAINGNKEGESIMGYKTCTKGVAVKLSAHFNSTEFDCHGSGCCSQTLINEQLVEYLEKIREHFGKPITITSGYRCATHNRNVGGATGSRHSKGDAADIVVSGVAPREVAKYAESIGIKGIGLYETSSDGHFVHIDTRDAKSFWYGQACAYRSTFGGATSNNTTSSNNTSTNISTSSDYSLKDFVKDIQEACGANADGVAGVETLSKTVTLSATKNVRHAAVKAVQKRLKSLGYDPGTADGIFGGKTRIAVINFQKANGCVADGEITAQNKTWKKLLGMN